MCPFFTYIALQSLGTIEHPFLAYGAWGHVDRIRSTSKNLGQCGTKKRNTGFRGGLPLDTSPNKRYFLENLQEIHYVPKIQTARERSVQFNGQWSMVRIESRRDSPCQLHDIQGQQKEQE